MYNKNVQQKCTTLKKHDKAYLNSREFALRATVVSNNDSSGIIPPQRR
jgi:hypothetical protein